MNMWFRCHFLFAGLFVSISALTPEECLPLVTPLDLANHSMLHDRLNFIVGYTDTEAFKVILKSTDSSWAKLSWWPNSNTHAVMHQGNRMNGTCFKSSNNVTFEDNTGVSVVGDITSTFHLLPTCEGCLVLNVSIVSRNLNKVLQLLKVDSTVNEEVVTTHSLYLMARNSTLSDSDLQHFRQQASCLGFPGEPDFHYDPKNDFCGEDEGLTLQFV
uniref:uncharacterized protein LOC124074372 n=1 Tax=Scatophagus argus TaxID=75038 RepID=UPI001ED7D422|nr:uncharacterized protein LOC124074372 [Scatophagus argus]